MQQSACNEIKNLENSIDKDVSELAEALSHFVQANLQPQTALCQRGIPDKNNAVLKIHKAHNTDIVFSTLFNILEKRLVVYESEVYDESKSSKKNMNHRQRRQMLEDIIQALIPLKKKVSDSELKLEKLERKESDSVTKLKSDIAQFNYIYAKVYFYRSLLFRPKGRSIPARKIEAIQEAYSFIKKSLNLSETLSSWRLLGKITLELLSLNEPYLSDDIISSGLHIDENFCLENNSFILRNDIQTLLTFSEITKDVSFVEKIPTFENINIKKKDKDYLLLLIFARIAFLRNKINESDTLLTKAISNAPEAFANPFWDDLVDFITCLKRNNCHVWKKAAIDAHKACYKNETEIGNIYLRWYWSRQSDLYDLAFISENKLEEKARIADSLKSRPILGFQALNNMKKNIDILEQILEQENEARDNKYLKKIHSKSRKIFKKEKFIDFKLLDNHWMVIHFYLNELEQCGYALIFDCETKNTNIQTFRYNELFNTFLSWQETELHEQKQKENNEEIFNKDLIQRGKSIHELCCEIGKTMPFIFELPENKSILWVPHGFIHRLPLHAAISIQTNAFLFEKHESRYLAAWHQLNLKNFGNGEGKHFLRSGGSKFKTITKKCKTDKWEMVKRKANQKHFFESLNKNLKTLVIICHGECDITNSFQSCLEISASSVGESDSNGLINPLEKKSITILDLLKSENNIKGCRIFLGACESDMASPIEFIVDEHLSLSAVLLSLGAKEVIGGLWKLYDIFVEDCYHQLLDSNNLSQSLNEWQLNMAKEWKEDKTDMRYLKLYSFASFRVTGFLPQKKQEP